VQEIYNLGLSENTIRTMLELNPELKDITDQEVIEKRQILEKIGCNASEIRNIISSNSLFLTRTNGEIINLISRLMELGFDTLNILFDSNPYILNMEPFEVNNYINSRLDNDESLEDIIDDLDSNPYLFNEF